MLMSFTFSDSSNNNQILTAVAESFNVSKPVMVYEYEYGNAFYILGGLVNGSSTSPTFEISADDTYSTVSLANSTPSLYNSALYIEFPYTQLTSTLPAPKSTTGTGTAGVAGATPAYTLFGLSYNSVSCFDITWLNANVQASTASSIGPAVAAPTTVSAILNVISQYSPISSTNWFYMTGSAPAAYNLAPLPTYPLNALNVSTPDWILKEEPGSLDMMNFIADSLSQTSTISNLSMYYYPPPDLHLML